MPSETKIEYHEVRLDDVVRYFVKGYERQPASYDWFLDPAKGRLIIRAYMADLAKNVPDADGGL